MNILDCLHAGLDSGVIRHWRYTKEMFNVKPEYLMTVAVADFLSNGYDGISGLDIEIRLERPTNWVKYQLVTDFAGLKQWFNVAKDGEKIGRKGRVDILSTANQQSHLVEIKGFDPSKAQIEKEMVRIQDFFNINAGANALVAGHIVFPSLVNCEKRLEKYAHKLLNDPTLTYAVTCLRQETGEDPEDGMPVYFTNSLSITRRLYQPQIGSTSTPVSIES